MTISFNGAVSAVAEAMSEHQPQTEDDALQRGDEALWEYIDSGLIYTSDVLTLWDGSTDENVYHDANAPLNIMDLITQSTIYQLRAEWTDAVWDGVDQWIESHPGHDANESDRDVALATLHRDYYSHPSNGMEYEYSHITQTLESYHNAVGLVTKTTGFTHARWVALTTACTCTDLWQAGHHGSECPQMVTE